MKELLEKLTSAYGPSGDEEVIRKVIREEIEAYVDEVREDVLGNLIAIKKGNGPKVMLAAHMDQIGLIVTHIDEKGFLRFSNVGGISIHNSFHTQVVFKNGTRGVISYETEIADMKDVKLDKMYIDIGAASREEAQAKVKIGDVAVYVNSFAVVGNSYVSGAMDDRVACAIQVEAIKRLAETENELYFVFTVQEEVGIRGARTSAYALDPDIGIALDVTATGDTPKSRVMDVRLGAGPAVKIKDSSVLCHPKVREMMIQRAEEKGIPYQLEVLTFGGTDSGAIHLSRSGVPSGVLSIPSRYIHSANEMVNIQDVENSVKLLVAILEKKIEL